MFMNYTEILNNFFKNLKKVLTKCANFIDKNNKTRAIKLVQLLKHHDGKLSCSRGSTPYSNQSKFKSNGHGNSTLIIWYYCAHHPRVHASSSVGLSLVERTTLNFLEEIQSLLVSISETLFCPEEELDNKTLVSVSQISNFPGF